MEIESLQVKRVKDNWDKHKTYIPKDGEVVFVDYGVDTKTPFTEFFILGDGENTLEWLLSQEDRVYYSAENIRQLISSAKESVKESIPYVSDSPSNTILPYSYGDNTTIGRSLNYARADHTHLLSQGVVESILDVYSDINKPKCRRVSAGTTLPATASKGDIFIKY